MEFSGGVGAFSFSLSDFVVKMVRRRENQNLKCKMQNCGIALQWDFNRFLGCARNDQRVAVE